MAATVDVGEDGGVGVVSSGHGHGYGQGCGEKRSGGMGMVNGQQRSMGNGQQQQAMMNGMDRGQVGQQQEMEARQLGQRMSSQQLGNGMGHQQSMNGMGHHASTVNERGGPPAKSSASKRDPCAEWGRVSSRTWFYTATKHRP